LKLGKKDEWRFITDHTEKGWTNHDFWARCLDFLRKYTSGDQNPLEAEKIYLICDSYKAHFPSERKRRIHPLLDLSIEDEENDPVKLALERNNIELIKVPEGATELFQPLDCRFFGALKSHVRAIFARIEIENLAKYFDGKKIDPNYKKVDLSKPEISNILVDAYWQLESGQAIPESWNQAIFQE